MWKCKWFHRKMFWDIIKLNFYGENKEKIINNLHAKTTACKTNSKTHTQKWPEIYNILLMNLGLFHSSLPVYLLHCFPHLLAGFLPALLSSFLPFFHVCFPFLIPWSFATFLLNFLPFFFYHSFHTFISSPNLSLSLLNWNVWSFGENQP